MRRGEISGWAMTCTPDKCSFRQITSSRARELVNDELDRAYDANNKINRGYTY